MKKRIIFFAAILFSLAASSQTTPKSFVQEDWDKLSQASKDSINKILLQKFEEAKKATASVDEENANKIIDNALQNVNGTTVLSFTSFPKAQLREDITKLKNVEEFTCTKCRALDLNILCNQLAQLPKLKRVNISGGTFKVFLFHSATL